MISIIVPIYNVDRFLRKCLNSVLKQTYADWECILVNDASPDNSLNICNEYAKKDPRFIIENKLINEGLQKARYDGFLKASGDYIMHLDADDWVEPTILATCLNLIEKYNCDYVETTIGRAIGRWRTSFSNKPGGRHIKHPELGKYIISFFGINSIGCSLCGKLYRADFLRLHYPEPVGLAYAEDAYVNLKLFPHLQSIYISNEVCYNHRWGGMTSIQPSLYG